MISLNKLSLIGLAWASVALTVQSQPCVNGISTNPHNPVNNQFVPLANQWFPGNGIDTHNPWLNQFSWYWSDGNPVIHKANLNWDHPWPGNAPTVAMVQPYDVLMGEGFEYLRPAGVHPDLYDYRWEDGWELLWMNMGYFPDEHPINEPAPGSYYANHNWTYEPLPSNAPYFFIYNRYRGLLRLFANLWYEAEAAYENIDVVLRFTYVSGETSNLTGLLRHASAYDRALSEPTDITEIHAPRLHARHLPGSTGTPDYTQWVVVDYQLGYDPCSCMSQGELILNFSAFSTMSVDIIGRSISIDVPITELNYREKDFLNMSAINTGSYEPGTEIYQSMDDLRTSYEAAQTQYLNDLNTYNVIAPLRMALEVVGLSAVGQYLASGITNITLTEDLYKWIKIPAHTVYQEELLEGNPLPPGTLELPAQMSQVLDTTIVKAFTDKAKKEIGRVFGNFSSEIFKAVVPGKPKPTAVPVATIQESVYKGDIQQEVTRASSPLKIPGSIPQAWGPAISLSPHGLPAYNEVLGKVALLNTPKPIARNEVAVDLTENLAEWSISRDLQLRFDEDLLFALNPALDFDANNTVTYAMLEITYEEGNFKTIPDDIDTLYAETNLIVSQTLFGPYGDMLLANYSSDWFPLLELSNRVFHISDAFNLTYGGNNVLVTNAFTPTLISIKLKIRHDFQFEQIGTSGEKIETFDIYTYPIYLKDGVNHLQTDGPWADGLPGYFDLYIPGLITLGDETITTGHPYVHHVDNSEIVINAQEVHITGPLQVQPGYTVVIQALEQIHSIPGASFNPKIHMRIKNDFYDTPAFAYADNSTVANFCNNSNAYQANTPSKALQSRIQQQMAEADVKEFLTRGSGNTVLTIFPNPARSELTVQATGAGIDRITVYDMATRPVMQASPGGASLYRMDISGLAQGVYIVRAECGDEVLTEKLVVAK